MDHGPEFVLGEELLHRERRQLHAQHFVALRRQPHHVQRLAAERHQHLPPAGTSSPGQYFCSSGVTRVW